MSDKVCILNCDKCGNEFTLSSHLIRKSDLEIDGKNLNVTYLVCPHCGKVYLIQVMDNKAYELQSEYLKQKARWQKIVGKNNPGKVDRNLIELEQSEYISLLAKERRLGFHTKSLKNQYEERIMAHLMPSKNQDV